MSVLPRIGRPVQAMDMAKDDREPDQSDLNAAARGLNMLGKSPSELAEIMKQHEGKTMFASKAIYSAAKQIRATKLRNGATDGSMSVAQALREVEDMKKRVADREKQLRSAQNALEDARGDLMAAQDALDDAKGRVKLPLR